MLYKPWVVQLRKGILAWQAKHIAIKKRCFSQFGVNFCKELLRSCGVLLYKRGYRNNVLLLTHGPITREACKR